MSLPDGVRRLFRLAVRSRDVSADVRTEIDFHIERTVEQLVASGLDPAAARREAERRFGDRARIERLTTPIAAQHQALTHRRAGIADLGRDLRHAVRGLRRAPGYTIVAALTFALGIGANVAVFSLLDGVLLRPLPYPEPDRLVRIYEHDTRDGQPFGQLTIADFRDWRREATSFEHLAAFRFRTASVTTSDGTVLLTAGHVSASFFDVLAVEPALGRSFRPDEERDGAANAVMLSHGAWVRLFGADAGVVGSTVRVNGEPATLVGVLPETFVDPLNASVDLFQPSDFDAIARDAGRARRMHFLAGFGRLRPGVTLERARAELSAIGRRIEAQFPDVNTGHGPNVVPLAAAGVRTVRPVLVLMMAAVGVLLLIACANLANLVLARSLSRSREVAVRAALGAGRARLARQIITEQLVLAGIGGVAGILAAAWAVPAFVALLGRNLPRADQVGIDLRVLGFGLGVAAVTAVVTGLVPAFIAGRLDLQSILGSEGRGGTANRRSHRLRTTLVGVQVALAVVLAAGSGLVLRSLRALVETDIGFSTERIVNFGAPLPAARYPDAESIRAFQARLLERLRSLPGVAHAGAAYTLPMVNMSTTSLVVEGRAPEPGPPPSVGYNAATPDYFRALGIPLVAGRLFDARDRPDAPPVVLVNEAAVRRFWPGENPVGARVRSGPDTAAPALEVVGVVGDIRRASVDRAPEPELYYLLGQDITPNPTYVIRATGSTEAMLALVRRELAALDPEIPLAGQQPLDVIVESALQRPRFLTTLLGAFAALALVLAAVGVHGVISFLVAERTRELGVRRALGASTRAVALEVLRKGMLPVALGLTFGLASALAVAPLLRSLLYGVSPTDVPTLAVVALVATGAGMAGCLVPARRASRIDPMTAMRE